ncbi:MAG: hypothetical protein IJI23_00375 [Lachnospiraceae bacterium]|nr:hypothetical protein [Lachnospiraceae bacterium]
MKIKTTRSTYIPKTNTSSKQVILDLLVEAIKATSAGDDLAALRFDPTTEIVHADFQDSYDARQINIAMDSGWAMIKDVIHHLDIG